MAGPDPGQPVRLFPVPGQGIPRGGLSHLGRSALDAVELTNVGANYLREHIVPEARLHYAITNPGGRAPNVVQAAAETFITAGLPGSPRPGKSTRGSATWPGGRPS
ncbi:MAG: hypothetical protein M0C28_30250 [Candidatus Moduliflexus flocculans]|nr:hypothetical protein [Candidatus Moduliflexus flocculans]